MTAKEQTPLVAPEAEAYVVGCLMVAHECMPEASVRLSPADFADPSLSAIFGVMVALHKGGSPFSLPAAFEALKAKGMLEAVGGTKRLADLASEGYLPSHFTHYARIVQDTANMRRMVALLQRQADNAYHVRAADHGEACGYFTDTAKAIGELANAATTSVEGKTLADILDEARLEAMKPKATTQEAATFNLTDIDCNGKLLARGNLVIVGACPSNGKSTLMLHAGIEAARQGHNVHMVSLEMKDSEIAERVTAHEMAQPKPPDGFKPEEYGYVAKDEILSRFWVHSLPSISIKELYALAKDAKRRGHLDMLIVDYLQLVSGPRHMDRQQEVAVVARTLKAIAMELDVPVIAGAQLNRNVDPHSEPMMGHLKESGEIEAAANVVLLLWTESKQAQRMKVKIEKNRSGTCADVELEWKREHFTLRTASILGEDLMAAETRTWGRR